MVVLLRRAAVTVALALALLEASGTDARADRMGFYWMGGVTQGRDNTPFEPWLDLFETRFGTPFKDWQTDPRWGLGFTFFKGTHMRGELEMAFQDRRTKMKLSDGSEWKAANGTLSLSLSYGVNLVPVPAPVVPIFDIGGAIDMSDFAITMDGSTVTSTPGAFSANGLSGVALARAGFEFFLSDEYSVGVYACHQLGTRTTLFISEAGDAALDATMNLPTANSYARDPMNPSNWTDLRYRPEETAIYASLRYNFRLRRAPGVVEP